MATQTARATVPIFTRLNEKHVGPHYVTALPDYGAGLATPAASTADAEAIAVTVAAIDAGRLKDRPGLITTRTS